LLLLLSLGLSTVTPEPTSDRRNTRVKVVMVLFAVGLVLDILIGAVLVLNNRQIRHAVSQAHLVKIAAYEACIASNQRSAADLKRWDEVLVLVNTMPTDAHQQAFIAGVEKANRTADAPRDCGRLVP
jgi:hypothetical protein